MCIAASRSAFLMICDPRSHHSRRSGVRMFGCRGRTHDVKNFPSARLQGICDHRAVASPPDRLRAHDGRTRASGETLEIRKCNFELCALHVIGVPSERVVTPYRVRRIRKRATSAAELRHRAIADSCGAEMPRQLGRREVWMLFGTRESSHVAENVDLIRTQDPREFVGASIGVADRPHSRRTRLQERFIAHKL